MRGITQKQFAAIQKVSPARVSQWIAKGIISTLPDGSIDPIRGERDLLKNRDGSKRLDWESSRRSALIEEKAKEQQGARTDIPQKSAKGLKPIDTREELAKLEVYEVVKQFVEKIEGEKFLIPAGTLLRVYGGKKGRVEIAFFPGRKEGR